MCISIRLVNKFCPGSVKKVEQSTAIFKQVRSTLCMKPCRYLLTKTPIHLSHTVKQLAFRQGLMTVGCFYVYIRRRATKKRLIAKPHIGVNIQNWMTRAIKTNPTTTTTLYKLNIQNWRINSPFFFQKLKDNRLHFLWNHHFTEIVCVKYD